MGKKVNVNASILIIGNEILSGRTQDTNTSTLAIWLNSIGVNVAEVRVIPDVEETPIAAFSGPQKHFHHSPFCRFCKRFKTIIQGEFRVQQVPGINFP